MTTDLRILLLADSHLGFDLPVRPRVGRRRRGYDFLANHAAALRPALDGEADIVVHAGDVFDRPSVDPTIAYQAYEPLQRVAQRGVPVFIVPGNHERSRLPHIRFASHSNVHIFDAPRTFALTVRGTTIALSGFPYEKRDVRTLFPDIMERTGWRHVPADVRLLCVHHCFEGATVGPGDFTFTTASDVIRARDILPDFAAVLTGHIHRHQVLTTDLAGRPLRSPVLYPGSIERTSFAEMDEPKGFMMLHVSTSEGQHDVRWEFRQLPARPMLRRELVVSNDMHPSALESAMRAIVADVGLDAVLSIRIAGELTDAHWRVLSSARMRSYVPDTMNVDIAPATGFRSTYETRPARVADTDGQLQLMFGS